MKKLLLSLLWAPLFAQSIDSIVSLALKNNPNLESIQKHFLAKQESIQRAANLPDPILKIGVNDMRLDRIAQRDLEPMQSEYLLVKQKFYFFGKRDLDKRLATLQAKVAFANYAEAKNALIRWIYIESANYLEATTSLKIIQKYIDLVRKSIALFERLSVTQSKSHMALMKSKLFLDSLRIKKERYLFMAQKSLKTLSYLCNEHIESVEYDRSLMKMDLEHIAFDQNPTLLKIEQQLHLQKIKVKRAQLDRYSDVSVEAGYFHRNGFKDYLSFGVVFSLPIYGTQDVVIEEEKMKALSLVSKHKDIQNALYRELKTLQEDFFHTKEMLLVIQKRSLPQIEHLLDLTQASIASGESLFQYFEVLSDGFDLELQRSLLQSRLLKIEAQILWLKGIR